MARVARRIACRQLTPEQTWELLLGTNSMRVFRGRRWRYFTSREEALAAWLAHRDELLLHGPRPWAATVFDEVNR